MIPSLLDKYLKQGDLPHIEKLIKSGVYGEGLSTPPCDTPTNWTGIATGCQTAGHGATSFYMHLPGEPLDLGQKLRSRTQLSRYSQAEYIWEVADQNGYTPFVINYPAGWPGDMQNGTMVHYTWPFPEILPRRLIPKILIKYSVKSENPDALISGGKALLKLSTSGTAEYSQATLHPVKNSAGIYDHLNISVSAKKHSVNIEVGSISEWLSVEIDSEFGRLPCLFQVKLIEMAPKGYFFTIERSTVFNTSGWSKPASFGEKLIRHHLTMEQPEDQTVGYMVTGKVEAYLKYAHKEVMNLARIIDFAKKEIEWDLCFFHIHHLDTTNHKSLAKIYPESPKYSEKSAIKEEQNVRIAYQIVDEMVGYLQTHVVDANTIVVLVSDHGAIPSWKIANIPYALCEAGLLHYIWDEDHKNYAVDWTKTRAYPYLEPPYIWVNLKGRDPQGIVEEKDYEQVRSEIIDVLTNLKDPETEVPIINLAMRKEDHEKLGQNGERVGDVVYFLNPPYEIFDDDLFDLNPSRMSKKHMRKGLVHKSKRCFGAHAYYLPQTKFAGYSISVPFIISGPGIVKNHKITQQIDLTDLAPTFSRLLNMPPPKQATGKVIRELFE